MNKTRYQTVRLTIPNGTLAGTVIEVTDKLDANYKKATKFVLCDSNIAGLEPQNYEFAVRQPEGQIIDFIPYMLYYGYGVAPFEEVGMEIDCDAAGRQIICQVKPMAQITADAYVSFIFKLEN